VVKRNDMATWEAVSGAGQLSRKSFDYEKLVKDTPSATTPIERALKTE
jgi:hypothetical protein